MIKLKIANTPALRNKLANNRQEYSRKKKNYHFSYANKRHQEFPHVIKFSGGRSSGMLLFVLLENKLIAASRGDVVIFNNTSAEHPATYDFVIECKHRCERDYGVPFFLTEFQTYEDASNGKYGRFPAYKLVNDKPYSEDNPHGYHCKGEVFEELISWHGFLPNQYTRTCTSLMKIYVSQKFLENWFSCSDKIERLGHFGTSTRINKNDVHERHLSNQGSVPKEIYIAKKEFCFARPWVREAQCFSDYTTVSRELITNPLIKQGFSKADLANGDIEYCSFIGFRGDEPHRLARIHARSMKRELVDKKEKNETDKHLSYISEPNGEHVYAPLAEIGIAKENVIDYWESQDWDLQLPDDASMSNCVYCFLKGGRKLLHIAQHEKNYGNHQENTPANLSWWVNLEQKYQRDLIAEKRTVRLKEKNPLIGFFGTNKILSYKALMNAKAKYASLPSGNTQTVELQEFNNLPCECTD